MKKLLTKLRCNLGLHRMTVTDKQRYLRTLFYTETCSDCGAEQGYQVTYHPEGREVRKIHLLPTTPTN